MECRGSEVKGLLNPNGESERGSYRVGVKGLEFAESGFVEKGEGIRIASSV